MSVSILTSGALAAFGGLNGVWAAAEGGSSLPSEIGLFVPYLNLGVIVVLVIMAATKKGFIPKWVLDDQEKAHTETLTELKLSHERELAATTTALVAAEKREEEYKQLNADLQAYQRDQLQPALIETTRVVSAYVQALARKGGGLE